MAKLPFTIQSTKKTQADPLTQRIARFVSAPLPAKVESIRLYAKEHGIPFGRGLSNEDKAKRLRVLYGGKP